MKLVLEKNGGFYGFVGEETGSTTMLGENIHVGDLVEILSGKNNNECIGVVGVFRDRYGVMGLAGSPISEYKIERIVESFRELTIGSYAGRYSEFNVREFIK